MKTLRHWGPTRPRGAPSWPSWAPSVPHRSLFMQCNLINVLGVGIFLTTRSTAFLPDLACLVNTKAVCRNPYVGRGAGCPDRVRPPGSGRLRRLLRTKYRIRIARLQIGARQDFRARQIIGRARFSRRLTGLTHIFEGVGGAGSYYRSSRARSARRNFLAPGPAGRHGRTGLAMSVAVHSVHFQCLCCMGCRPHFSDPTPRAGPLSVCLPACHPWSVSQPPTHDTHTHT